MYNPSINRITDLQEINRFVNKHAFGLIINTHGDTPLATHLPFHTKMSGDKLEIYGHFAKANKQWKCLDSGKSLVIFSEPHAYISPAHYDQMESVPTWNYCTVQCYGRATIIEDENECLELLRELIEDHDMPYLNQWKAIDSDYKTTMLKGIVMFRIDVEEVHGKYKLSQNKNISEQQRISEYLMEHGDSNAREIGDLMAKNIEMNPS